MTGYNKLDDKKLYEEEVVVNGTLIFVGSIMQYKDGEKKIQIARKIPGKIDWAYDKLGRIRKDEVEFIIGLLKNLKEQI